MSQWSEELNFINKALDLLQENVDNSPIIITARLQAEPSAFVDRTDRQKHLRRIKNLSPWQKILIDPELLKESENV